MQALETAEMYDRIHLRTTYYNYAKHLEESGDPGAAIPQYVYVLADLMSEQQLLTDNL